MTTINDIHWVLKDVRYPGYTFCVRSIEEPFTHGRTGGTEVTGFLLWAVYDEPDIVTAVRSVQTTRKWYISTHAVKSEIVQTALKCVLTSAEHRVREHFKYKGQRAFGPHFDADALAELAAEKKLDYRKD